VTLVIPARRHAGHRRFGGFGAGARRGPSPCP